MNLLTILAIEEKARGSPLTKVVHAGQEKDRESSSSDAWIHPTDMGVIALH